MKWEQKKGKVRNGREEAFALFFLQGRQVNKQKAKVFVMLITPHFSLGANSPASERLEPFFVNTCNALVKMSRVQTD